MVRRKTLQKKNFKSLVKKEVSKAFERKVELKYHDYDITSSNTIPVGGVNFYITNIADGTLVTERLGEKIRGKKVEIRMRLSASPGATTVQPVRVLLIRDMNQGNQAGSLIPDVLETGFIPTIQQYNWDNRHRFQILYDNRVSVAPTQTSSVKNLNINIKRTMLMKYDGAGAASNGQGRLMLALVSDTTDGTQLPIVNFGSRFYYEDA